MTRRTQVWLAVIAILVVLGTATLAMVRLGALSGEALLKAPVETVGLDLPDRSGYLSLDLATDSLLAPYVARHVTVERAGQHIIDTPLFPAPVDPRLGLGIVWFPAEGRAGPWVRLTDPANDILLDLRAFVAWRIVDHGGRAWLVRPTGVAAAGYVIDPAGMVRATQGQPLVGQSVSGLSADAEGVPLGRVLVADGRLMFQAGPVGVPEDAVAR